MRACRRRRRGDGPTWTRIAGIVTAVVASVGATGSQGAAAQGGTAREWSGIVVDALSGRAVESAEVVFLGDGLVAVDRRVTDAEGRWRGGVGIATGAVHIGVSAPGYASWLSEPLTGGEGALEIRLVRVGDPPPPPPLEISPERVASWCGVGLDPGSHAVVVGRVVDRATGEGLAGVETLAEWGGAEIPRLVIGGSTGPPYRATASGEDGLFLFCGLPAGEPTVFSIQAPGLPSDSVRLTPEAGSVHRIELGLELSRPGDPAALFGTAVDGETGEPLAGVRVEVAGGSGMAVSNERGFFVLDSVPSGLQVLEARHLAYAPREVPVVLEPGRSSEVRLELATRAFELDPITVTVRSRARLRDMQMFDHRRAMGFGTFFTRDELEKLRPWVLGDLLRDTPGLQVRRSGAFGPITVRSRGQTCTPAVWVDGMRWRVGSPLTEILGLELEAVEVHKGLPPPEFYPGACVTVVAWTKRGR